MAVNGLIDRGMQPDYKKCVQLAAVMRGPKPDVKALIEQHSGPFIMRQGVWNPYMPATKAEVWSACGILADIYYDKDTDTMYVSIPCQADLW